DIAFSTDVESMQGIQRLNDAGLDDSAPLSETVVIWSTDGRSVDDPAFRQRVQDVTNEIRSIQMQWSDEDGIAYDANAFASGIGDYPPLGNYYELSLIGHPLAEQAVSDDRTSTIVFVGLRSVGETGARMHDFFKSIDGMSGEGIEVATIGQLSFNERFSEIAEQDLVTGESIGIPMALVVLVAVFGALLAPVLPLVLAICSIAVALGLAAVIGGFVELQLFIQNMVTMLGLAVGIDYALFIVERFREERRTGRSVQGSIERAGASASKAVVFSGATVVLSLAGVMIVPTNIFRSLGLGAVLVVVVAVAASLTLLPAMLSLLGDRINWPRRPKPIAPESHEHLLEDVYDGFWGRLTRVVMARPVVSAGVAGGLLIALMIPAFGMKTGILSFDSLPPGRAADAYRILTTQYPAGLVSPVQFVIGGDADQVAQAVDNLQGAVLETGLFAPVVDDAVTNADGTTAEFSATLLVKSDSEEAYDAVRDLRNTVIPATIAEFDDVEVWVTGAVAANKDFTDVISRYTPIVFAFVLGFSFLLLMLAFRSIVVPIKAMLLNLLSVGATWGILVLVFQEGYLAGFLGFQQTPVIETWIPILLFAVLFGLSMDYHVFLLSRIREYFDLTHRNRDSVAAGLHATARIITGAALIMVVVFGAFASGSLVALQQLGFGLAVAVFLDATIVRSVLVPATMALLGDRNWYLPRWLHWLPDLRVEGEALGEAARDDRDASRIAAN
ncbi:MAG TPA: MMPL family transporter, partial [Thermomicrobiales bacterium]|nr:MMPL family transporter [Thermomicrobiales bacterium]